MTLPRLLAVVLVTALVSAGVSGACVWLYLSEYGEPDAVSLNSPIADFVLLDHRGKYHRLYRYKDAEVVVLYSHEIGCPLAHKGLIRLNQIKTKYKDHRIEFLVLNAGLKDDRNKLVSESQQLNIDLPVLQDSTQLVVEELAIKRSGVVLVIDTDNWQVRYRGPIDGKQLSDTPGQFKAFLEDAIDSILQGKRIKTAVVDGGGCYLEFEDKQDIRKVSYRDEVTPILQRKCISCHRPGGIGPWVMDRYETLKSWAPRMKQVIMTDEMPPWHADPLVGSFNPDRSLSISERRSIIHWINSGSPKIDSEDPLVEKLPAIVEEWPLGKPDLVMNIPQQKIPATGLVPYRWLKIPVPIESDRWVSAVQLKPSNSSIMHHGFVFIEYPKHLKKLQPQWLEGLNGFFVAHVPGINVLPLPENSGQFLPKGSTLVFQLHYITSGKPTSDQPKLAIYFHAKPPALEYTMASASNMKIRIPPNAPDYEETAQTVMSEDGLLRVFYPHMHYRGKRMQYEAVYPDSHSEPLLSVPHYDIHWQSFYQLAQPKVLPAGTKIKVTAAFDNSPNNPVNPDPSQEVRWGLKSRDEMLVGYFMYTRKRKDYSLY